MAPPCTAPAVNDSFPDTEFIPGTVWLVDETGCMPIQHASGRNLDVVLVPTPSADPNDPLNWPKRRKILSVSSMAMYVNLTSYPIALSLRC